RYVRPAGRSRPIPDGTTTHQTTAGRPMESGRPAVSNRFERVLTIQRLELTPALLLLARGDRGAVGRDRPRAAGRRAVDQGREALTAALGGVVEDDRLVPAQRRRCLATGAVGAARSGRVVGNEHDVEAEYARRHGRQVHG